MPNPGDVVVTDFPGATGIKRRPAVIVSTTEYHTEHKDVILGVLTTNLRVAATAADYVLTDWAAAGLQQPSAFRAYFATVPQSHIRVIGRLSDQDWAAIQQRILRAIEVAG